MNLLTGAESHGKVSPFEHFLSDLIYPDSFYYMMTFQKKYASHLLQTLQNKILTKAMKRKKDHCSMQITVHRHIPLEGWLLTIECNS